jgi:phage shock protein C
MTEYSGNGKHLVRSAKGQWVAGVCAGLGEYFKVDANVIRLVFAALTIAGALGIVLYLAAWVILPEEGEDTSIAQAWISKSRS